MSTFAILGATGTIGGLVLKTLLETTPHQIHCFVRSKSKLVSQVANYSTTPSQEEDYTTRLHPYEGGLSDISTLELCLQDTQIIYLCAAASKNTPNLTIAQSQAHSVIQALRNLHSKTPTRPLPKLIMLTSAETEPKFTQEYPWLLSSILFCSNSNIYLDLIAAEKYLRTQTELVQTIFMKPGGLSHDVSRGHVVSEDKQQTFLSFVDLAAAMVEVGETAVGGSRWDGKVVSVYSPGGKARVEWSAMIELVRGLLVHFLPWMSRWVY